MTCREGPGLQTLHLTWGALVWKHLLSVNPLNDLLLLLCRNGVQGLKNVQPREGKEQQSHPGRKEAREGGRKWGWRVRADEWRGEEAQKSV